MRLGDAIADVLRGIVRGESVDMQKVDQIRLEANKQSALLDVLTGPGVNGLSTPTATADYAHFAGRHVTIDQQGITILPSDTILGLPSGIKWTVRGASSYSAIMSGITIGTPPNLASIYGITAQGLGTGSGSLILLADDATAGHSASIKLDSVEGIKINSSGNDIDTIIKSADNDTMFALDAGNNAIGIGAAPNANVVLDVVSTTKAFRPPVMTSTQRDAIPSPQNGMVIWNSTTTQLEDYNGGWAAV